MSESKILDDVYAWLGDYISVMRDDDLRLLTLWAAHTWLAEETYTTPRLIIDSPMPEAGKTTTLEHLDHLCRGSMMAANVTSAALLVRAIHEQPTTILIDEADRSLDPKNDKTAELIAIVNSGYKRGATRPVLEPIKDGGFRVTKMSTFAPVAMAGNNPSLPDDTRSRSIRVLLFPDHEETVSESDWEMIEAEAHLLANRLSEWADSVRDLVRTGERPSLPEGVRARARERWLPLKRVAVAHGGEWPEIVDRLAHHDVEQIRADKEDGLTADKPATVLLQHIHDIWPVDRSFVETKLLIADLTAYYPRIWSHESTYGKNLTPQRMGRMLVKAFGINSTRYVDGGTGRGYERSSFEPVWRRLSIVRADES